MIALLLLGLGAAANSVAYLEQATQRHCVRCHNEDSSLDLRTLPPVEDRATWLRVLKMVQTMRMPPADDQKQNEKRYPLELAERNAIIGAVSDVLGPALDRPAGPRFLDQTAWSAIVRDFATPSIDRQTIDHVLAPVQSAHPSMTGETRSMDPAYQLALDGASIAVCEAVATADAGRGPTERRFLSASAIASTHGIPAKAAAEVVRPLFESVFARAPSPTELRQGEGLLRQIQRSSVQLRDAWVGLCTYYLGSSQLLYFEGWRP